MNKKNFASLLLLCLFTSGIFSSCIKDKKNDKLDPQVEQFNTDANDYKAESDRADQDINGALGDIPSFGKAEETYSSPMCGVTIDSTQIAQHILFFNFDGVTPCFSPSCTRSGQIKVQLTSGNLWSDAGSVLTLTYIDYKIVRMSDNKSIKFNGVKTLKNLNGNNWLTFLLGSSTLKYRERSFNINVVFDDGSTSTWNSARTTEWSYSLADSKVTFSAVGDTILNGFNTVDSWGVNRYGMDFTTYYNTAIVSNSYCGFWRPNSGELVHHLSVGDFTLTLGVDQQGNASSLACAYGYKISWTGSSGNVSTVVLSY
ncbi:MAG: hypothetical protein WCI97_08335 [Bacteroidota bacterium]